MSISTKKETKSPVGFHSNLLMPMTKNIELLYLNHLIISRSNKLRILIKDINNKTIINLNLLNLKRICKNMKINNISTKYLRQ